MAARPPRPIDAPKESPTVRSEPTPRPTPAEPPSGPLKAGPPPAGPRKAGPPPTGPRPTVAAAAAGPAPAAPGPTPKKKRDLHKPVLFGLSIGVYAAGLAGVSYLQAATSPAPASAGSTAVDRAIA